MSSLTLSVIIFQKTPRIVVFREYCFVLDYIKYIYVLWWHLCFRTSNLRLNRILPPIENH